MQLRCHKPLRLPRCRTSRRCTHPSQGSREGLTLRGSEHRGCVTPSEELVDAQRLIASLPTLPVTLERLSLGYRLGDRSQRLSCIEELAQRVPRLRGQDVFLSVRHARLRVLSTNDGSRLVGIAEGLRPLTQVTRVRRSSQTQLHFESPPGIPFIADGNPCHFAPGDGSWKLFAGRLRGEVRVNNHTTSVYQLLPGDLISIQGAGTFRFEVVP